jgi:hypothetical protein
MEALIETKDAEPRQAAIQAMESLPDDLLNHLDPETFVRAIVDDDNAEPDS